LLVANTLVLKGHKHWHWVAIGAMEFVAVMRVVQVERPCFDNKLAAADRRDLVV
jgi:hypothetical protein